MQSSLMKNIGAKNFGYNVKLMKWSNRMDLLAFSNNKGEVIVQRLNWQNLWTQEPPSDGAQVRGLDWRPDERILAIGYDTGIVLLIDVENQEEIHEIELDAEIKCLCWTQNTKEYRNDGDDIQDNRMFRLPHEIYLPPLPNFHTLSSNARRSDYNSFKSYCTNIFNILLVGLSSGCVHLYVFGVLFCGRIDVANILKCNPKDIDIQEAKMSADFRTIFIFVKQNGRLKKLIFENEIFSQYTIPLLNLATKHAHILNTMTYIDDIIQCITEAWESALLEMEQKLSRYSASRPDGAISAEFLELLIFGYASDQLEQFLTRDLTEKGLKKLGNSIEISYSTISQLVIEPLHTGIINICFHLNCIKGMSRNVHQYKEILGEISNEVISNAGAFLIKALELQRAIEQSTRDYKIFWSWLYGVILRLMDETVPDEVAAVSQQDINYLAEFLNTFDQIEETSSGDMVTKHKFNLERVGQYLQEKNIQIPFQSNTTSEWKKLLNDNECLKNSQIIYPHHKELSLVQEHKLLRDSVDDLFLKPEEIISKKFEYKSCIDIADVKETDELQIHHIQIEEKEANYFITLIQNEYFYFTEISPESTFIKVGKFHFTETPFTTNKFENISTLRLRDLQFYNDNYVSMLLTGTFGENQISKHFVQFPIQHIHPRMVGVKLTDYIDLTLPMNINNLYEILDSNLLRTLETNDGHYISVSGSRKIATILSESQKRLRHYEMEVEDDDDDADMSQTNKSLDVSRD